MTALRGDRAKVGVLVKVPPEAAFRIFTEEIDQWWRRGVRYRVAGKNRGIIHLEGAVGGRLYESFEVGGESKIFETGRVLVFDPPRKLAFEWRGANFAEGEVTRVDVTFEPSASGTMVTVVHEGFAALRPDHPARHGLAVESFVRLVAMWWSDLVTSFREHVPEP